MADNMFQLSGGAPAPVSLPSMSGLSRDYGVVQPVVPNGMDTLGKWTDIQNARNQQMLFQQTFAARQRSGEILAGAPDTETAIKQLLADPVTAPFAGETINTLRSANLSLIQMQGAVQEQAQSGLGAIYKSLPAVIADPSQWDQVVGAQMATLSPMVREKIAPAIASMKESLLGGLPDDPAAARAILTHRLVGYSMGAGVPPDSINRLIGQPITLNQGGMQQYGVQLPSEFGGGASMSNGIPLAPAPERVRMPLGPGGAETMLSVTGNAATPVTVNGLAPPQGATTAPAGGAPPADPDTARATALGRQADQFEQAHGIGQGAYPLLQGPSQSAAASNEAIGKVGGDVAEEMAADAREIPVAAKRFQVMEQALQGFKSGGLSTVRGSMAKFMQGLQNMGFDIPQSEVDKVGDASLSDLQVFDANVKPLVIGELKQAAQGTGRVMRSEVDQFLAMMSVETDPRALVRLMDQARYQLQVGYARSEGWPKFRQGIANGSIQGYEAPDYYAYFNHTNNFQNPPQTTAGGLQLGPSGTNAMAPASAKPPAKPGFREGGVYEDKHGNRARYVGGKFVPMGAQ